MEGQAERKPGTVKEGGLVNTDACVTLVEEYGHLFVFGRYARTSTSHRKQIFGSHYTAAGKYQQYRRFSRTRVGTADKTTSVASLKQGK